MKFYLVAIATVVLLFPTSLFAQFKHDIGLKVSTNENERFQMEYRWHPNEKWAFTGSLIYGQQYHSATYWLPIVVDSTIKINDYWSSIKGGYVAFGAMRKLSFMKHNFYYVGANLGVGQTRQTVWTSQGTHYLDSMSLSYGIYAPGEEIETYEFTRIMNGFSINSRLYLGADVPIIDRLSLNFECGLGSSLNIISDKFSGSYPSKSIYFGLGAFASAGLRYRFGQGKKE